MKSLARRAFLRMAPSVALAGKLAADQAIASVTGLTGQGGTLVGHPLAGGINGGGPSPDLDDTSRIRAFFERFGLPSHERDRLWDETRFVGHLDPDIAAKRSWSMSVKILTQRERNFQRQVDQRKARWTWDDARSKFAQTHGFRFWW